MELIENSLIFSLKLNQNVAKMVFTHPKESRFSILFKNTKSKNRKRKALVVNPKYIMLDLDERTSIIIKNIPHEITSSQFENIILSFCKEINFYYVPISIKTRKRLRVAFVNVINYKHIVPIYMGLTHKIKFVYNNPNIKMEICYSKVQGRIQLIKKFLNELIQNKYNKYFL